MTIDDADAKRLMASILKQAYEDFTKDKSCPDWCQYKDGCKQKKTDRKRCDAREFIHSAWCASLCDGLNIDHQQYVKTCIEKHRLSRNVYRYVEGEIRSYWAIKKEYETAKDDIINETPMAIGEVRGNAPGDTTAAKVIKIALNKRLADMERKIKAIEAVYKSLDSNRRRCMEEIWLDKYTNSVIAYRLGVSDKTIRRWKRHIVYSVAIELNYL